MTAVDLSVRKRLNHGAIWSLVGAGISKGSGFLGTIAAAWIMHRQTFGEYGAIQATIGMVAVLANLGVSVSATRVVAAARAKDRDHLIAAATAIMVTAWVGAFIVALGYLSTAHKIAADALSAPKLEGPLLLSVIWLVLSVINGAQVGILTGTEAFKEVAGINVTNGTLNLIGIVAGAAIAGVGGVCIGIGFAFFGSAMHGYILVRRGVYGDIRKVDFDLLRDYIEDIVLIAIPIVSSNLLVAGVNWGLYSMLAHRSEGFREIASFHAANTIRMMFQLVSANLCAGLMPVLSGLQATGRLGMIWPVVRSVLRFNLMTVGIGAIMCASFSPWLVHLFGKAYSSSWPVLALLCICAFFQVPNGVLILSMNALRYSRTVLVATLIYGAIALGTFSILPGGATDLAFAQIVGTVVALIALGLAARKHFRQPLKATNHGGH